ncbi:MAG: cation:proton antiporter [Lentisphaerae bacterium RIFOXYB12_FULL_65_16]|nr:MAG: cation:proton antiporter [Lentisphaerae bacterium RIFOXYA12_64_32]OGV93931.1 MAG: cation:proton antiporter [Lentisphaerae bacterium RIFOXYB12_FULL_65_16]
MTTPSESYSLLLALMAPLVGAVLVMLTGRRPNVREACSFTAAGVMFATVASLVKPVLAGEKLVCHLATILPGVSVTLRADCLSMVFALVASFLWIITVLYSLGYMRGLHEHAQTRFSACFALALFGAIGCAFADNLFTLYLFYEIVSITTYPLVAHHQDAEGYQGGRKYLVYLTTTAKGLVLPAMILIYVMCGTLDFSDNIRTGIFPNGTSRVLVTVVYVCLLLGFAKNGVMPFHNWLPGAMVAPTPVSALLHAVAVVKVGVFSTTRVMLFVFGVDTMDAFNLGIPTAYFVSFTILAASLIALSKDNLKARLAYSTVSQLSYIILGVALLTPAGIQGGIVHIANHAFAKITLFFCAGAIYVATHRKNISQMRGLGRVMPFTFAAFAVASLSMIGAPPVAGFITKWYLLVGAIDARQIGIIVVLLASTILNVAYFAPVVYQAYFGKLAAGDSHEGLKEASPALLAPLLISALISVVIGFYPDFFMSFIKGMFL